MSSGQAFEALTRWLASAPTVRADNFVCRVHPAEFTVDSSPQSTPGSALSSSAPGPSSFTIRGLAAATAVEPGDVLLRVPGSAFLCLPNALKLLPVLDEVRNRLRRTGGGASASPNAGKSAAADDAAASSSSGSSDDEYVLHRGFNAASASARRRYALSPQQRQEADDRRFARGLADDTEFLLSCALVLLRWAAPPAALSAGSNFNDPSSGSHPAGPMSTAAVDGFAAFVQMLPSPDDMTNVDFWSPAAVDLLASSARMGKAKRRQAKAKASFERVRRLALEPNADLLPPAIFTERQWRWAQHILGSRCFNYTPPTAAALAKAARKQGDAQDGVGTAVRRQHRRGGAVGLPRRPAATAGGPTSDVHRVFGSAVAEAECASSSSSAESSLQEEEDDDDADEAAEDADEEEEGETTSTSSEDEEDAEEEPEETYTMVPLADLCNHSAELENADFDFDAARHVLAFTVTKPIAAGEQVFIKYNGMDAWKFCKYYGFCPLQLRRHADCFPVRPPPMPPLQMAVDPRTAGCKYATLRAVEEDIASATKRQLFDPANGGDTLLRHCHVTSEGPNMKLLGAMRLRHLSRDEMLVYPKAFGKAPLSSKNEFAAFTSLRQLIEAAIAEINEARSRSAPANACESPRDASPQDGYCAAVAAAMRGRDLCVLRSALEVCRQRANEHAELLYYGETKAAVARRAVLEERLRQLRGHGGSDGDADPAEEQAPKAAAAADEPSVQDASEAALRECAPAWRQRTCHA